MTQKLIKVSECDVCGREVREPETTSAVSASVIKQSEDSAVMDVHNGARFEVCDDCMQLPGAQLLRLEGVRAYLPGTLEFTPTDNANSSVAVATRTSGLIVVGNLDEEDREEEKRVENKSNSKDAWSSRYEEVSCPFCGWGPNVPTAVASHMRHMHKNNRAFKNTMARMFPTGKYAKEVAEKAASRRGGNKRALSNIEFMTPEMAAKVS